MCLFKKKDFKEANTLNSLVGAGIFAIILAIVLPFITAPNENLASKFALAQLSLSSVGFILIIVTLCFTIVQLRKSMAKPKLEVIFSETGKPETTIEISRNIKQDIELKEVLRLSVLNTGNAITSFFQIDFSLPSIYRPEIANWAQLIRGTPFTELTSKFEIPKGERVVSIYNNRQLTCFVNKLTEIPFLSIRILPENIKEYTNIEIKYKIYGDWAETQEGTLKVKINKQ